MQHKVFVYGTLKSGFPNNHIIKDAQLIGPYETQATYPLYLEGERFSPWLVDDVGQGHCIKGEVFLIDDGLLVQLDWLERTHLSDGYLRKKITVLNSTNQVDSACCYFKRKGDTVSGMIRTAMLDEYTLEHAKLYAPRKAQ